MSSVLTGVGIGRGIAVGPVLRMPSPLPEPSDAPSARGADAEKARAADAMAATATDLRQRAGRAAGSAADVLEAQALMAEDPTLKADVDGRIDGGATADRAVFDGGAAMAEMLAGLGGYLGERAADLHDISSRIRAHLAGVPAPAVPDSDVPFVLVARDLAPADTALLDLSVVRALVCEEGGPTSHTAILAREKGIVAVVGVRGALGIVEGTSVVVDAASGEVESDIDEARTAAAEREASERAARTQAPIAPGRLADGTALPLLANLGSLDGIAAAVEAGAEGVGLFRTEVLFLDATEAPTVDAQVTAYRTLLDAFPGRKVVVRVLDAGADKPLSFLTDSTEENPALGLRGLRVLRAQGTVLEDQLTALARAADTAEADLQVMAPMVATTEEARWFAARARELGIRTPGVMIEVPSAALVADRLLAEVEFASIGTNDLTQYTMAADRLLGSVASYQDPWHPAVLRLVGEVCAAGQRLGRPVGICGEAAADPELAVVLAGLGATTLSMSPPAIAEVRGELLRWTLEDARTAARAALDAEDADAARAAVRALTPDP